MRLWSRSLFTKFVLSVGLPSALFASAAQADGVVTTDFVFQIDNSIFNSAKFDLTSQLTGNQSVKLDDMTIQDEAPVSVKGIQAQVAYKMRSSSNQILLGTEIALASESFSAQLSIGEISVDAWIDVVVGSHTIRSHAQGTCKNVQISLPEGKGSLMGSLLVAPDRNGRPVISLPWFEAAWGADAWTIAPFSCVAAPGFGDKMAAGLRKFLNSPSTINAQLKKLMNDRLVTQQKSIDDFFTQPMQIGGAINGLKLMLKPKALQNLKGEQFQLRGDLDFVFPSASVSQAVEARAGGAPKSATLFTMMLPEGLVTTVSDMAYRTGFFNYRKRGQEIAAFRDLMNGTLSKWYVWAELNSFPATADILFDFSAPSSPRFSGFTDGNDGTLYQALTGALGVQVWSPTVSGHEKQIQFNTPIDGTYRIGFEKDAAGVTQFRAVFSDLNLALSHAWDPAYLLHAHDTAVNDATMQSQITASLKKDGFSLEMGTFAITDRLTLSPTALRKTNGWVLIDWK